MSISLAILVSGRGSNLVAILDAIKNGRLDALVPVVISNKADAGALARAGEFGVKTEVVESKGLGRKEHEEKLLAVLSQYKVDYVVLSGYMRVLTTHFLNRFQSADGHFNVINIHPSRLPDFPGKSAYDEAFAAGVKESGITIHLVDEKVDHGAILAQQTFPRLPEDTLEKFKARGLAIEHQLFPQVLQQIADQGIEAVLEAQAKTKPKAETYLK